MKIGFDISQTGTGKAGCGYLAHSLIGCLAGTDTRHQYVLYPTFGDTVWDVNGPGATVHIERPNFRRGLAHPTLAEAQNFWRNPPADFEAQLGAPDIVHANNFFCPRGLRRARLVYTLYDLTFLEYCETATEANRIACFAGVFQASLFADFVVAISQASRDKFLAAFPHYPADRVRVAPLASRFERAAGGTPSPRLARLSAGGFWLNVGTIEPRKNQRGLLKAYARLKAHQGTCLPLVLAGGRGWLMEDFDSLIGELGLREDVLVLGYVEESELQWLYQNCFAFVYPSLYEGFGLPALEAMSLGAPVLTSNRGALPETVGSAGIFVDPSREEDLFQGMLKLAADDALRGRLSSDSLERAKEFSWTRTARKVLEVYEEVLQRARFNDVAVPASSGPELRALPAGG